MKIELKIELDLDDQQLAAMACVANKGPTNRRLPYDAVIEFWAAYLFQCIESGKAMNLSYSALDDAARSKTDERLQN